MRGRFFAWLSLLAWFSTLLAVWLPVMGNDSPALPVTFLFSLLMAVALTALACYAMRNDGRREP